MENIKVEIENLKCNGCANTIKNNLLSISGVLEVEIEREISLVNVIHNGKVARLKVLNRLKSLGYPEVGTVSGIDEVMTNAKSYVSCAIGRLSE